MTSATHQRRYIRIQEIGCLCCRRRGWYSASDVHHLNLGGRAGQKRRGNARSVALCPWHHRGIPLEGLSQKETARLIGPSLKHEPIRFRKIFGSDDELLAEQNQLIAEAEARVVGRVA